MRLGVKHANQQPIVRADFSGGLNTTANVDGIAENQLAVAVNVEVDHSTGRLKTVAGTTNLFFTPFENVTAALYDEINRRLLIVTADRKVYLVTLSAKIYHNRELIYEGDPRLWADFEIPARAEVEIDPAFTLLGTLSGGLYPVATPWEDGLLIASGSKLQYFNGTALETIDSPTATSVYIRAGRVLITDDNNVRYSGVGDETNWAEDTNDDSSSKFVEAGYKDGGKLVGMVNLSSDLLLIKNNRRLYRLSGEFPNWQISEISRNVEVSGRMGFCAVADSVFILGRNEVQNIQTTNTYGDMKPENIATLIIQEVQKLPANAMLRHVPPLEQIWAISGRTVLVFDLITKSWFKREFNSPVIDVLSIGDEVLIVKPDQVSRLNAGTFYDAGKPLIWKWQGQRLISQHEYLLKRTQVSCIPLSTRLYAGQIRVGAVIIGLPIPAHSVKICANRTKIYKCRVKICLGGRRRFVYVKGEPIYENLSPIYGNRRKLFGHPTFIKESRNVFRSRFIDVSGQGSGGGVIFNSIIMDIAEV